MNSGDRDLRGGRYQMLLGLASTTGIFPFRSIVRDARFGGYITHSQAARLYKERDKFVPRRRPQ